MLVVQDAGKRRKELSKILDGKPKSGSIPPLWDGYAGERIAEFVVNMPETSA